MTIQESLNLALKHEQAGELGEAEKICRGVLDRQANTPGAWHLLGMIAGRVGRNDVAVEMMLRAIAIDPNVAEINANCGEFQRRLGKYNEAVASLRRAVELKPALAGAWNNLGSALKDMGKLDDALAAFEKAVELRPGLAVGHGNIGITLRGLGRLDDSLAALDRAIGLEPSDAGAHSNRGNTLRDMGRWDEAISEYRRAIELKPDFAAGYANLGNVLSDQMRFDEAVEWYQKAVRIRPEYPEALAHIGNALRELGRFAEAMTYCREAIRIRPEFAEAYDCIGNVFFDEERFGEAIEMFHKSIGLEPSSAISRNNLAMALGAIGKFDEAIVAGEKAVQLDPKYAEGFNTLGNLLAEEGRYAEAAEAFRRAIQLKPGYADAHVNWSFILLLNGDFEKGFAEHQWRERGRTQFRPRQFAQSKWDGGELNGRTILLHSEQGLGDTIQFVRYVPLVAARGGRILISCPGELVELLAGLPEVSRVTSEGDPGGFDCHCPLMSLPAILGTRLGTIPGRVPYLNVSEKSACAWRNRLISDGKPRVGLIWAGSSKHKRDRRRSIDPRLLTPLKTTGAHLYSLQKGLVAPPESELIDFTGELSSLADTAALVRELDLVISVDTAAAHLAGAMGKPVWVLIPFVPDWRWMRGRMDSPWYPTMRLFRQAAPGDWDAPIRKIVRELGEFAGK